METLINWLKDNALLTLIVGVVITEIFKMVGKFRQRRITRKIFKINLKLMISQIEDQSNGLYFLGKTITVDQNTILLFTYDGIPSHEIFQSIGYENLYMAFFTGLENLFKSKKQMEALNSLWNSVKYFHRTDSLVTKDFNDFYSKFQVANSVWMEAAQNVEFIVDRFLVSPPVDTSSEMFNFIKDYLQLRTETFVNKESNSTTEIFNYHSKLKNLYIQHSSIALKYKIELNYFELMTLIQQATAKYKMLLKVALENSSYFSNLSKTYKLRKKDLEAVLDGM